MHYEVYIDVVFLTNLLMDYILLWFVGRVFRCRKSFFRTLLGAFLGALFSSLILCIPFELFTPAFILLHGACGTGMLILGCGLKKGSLLVKSVLTLYLAAFLCGGFWETADHGNLTMKTFLLLGTVTWLLLTAWSYLQDSIKIRMKNVYPLTLSYQGKTFSFYGFYDSGNLLMDSVTGKPVSIGKPEILEQILSEKAADQLRHLQEKPEELQDTEIAGLHPHLISYRGIDREKGMLLAVTLEKLCVQTAAEVVQIESPVFAFPFEPSAFGKEYEVLLNSRLLQ